MKIFKTNLLIGLSATVVALAIEEFRYLVGAYDLVSAVIALIISLIICIGFAYLMDGISYIFKKIQGGK